MIFIKCTLLSLICSLFKLICFNCYDEYPDFKYYFSRSCQSIILCERLKSHFCKGI
ncbi:hypothetical protein ABFS83_09G038500 [Erythranthe nasuta]